MRKLVEVEEATALMTEAKDWGVWRWLTEKKRVRTAADRAVDALAVEENRVKDAWSDDLKKAYRELEAKAAAEADPKARRAYEKARQDARDIDPQIKAAVERVKEADEIAYNARMDAENTFDEAEKRLSASMAREGTQKAIDSWALREKAIRKAEAAARKSQ